jgi:putative alpha-1,2-mannosidase
VKVGIFGVSAANAKGSLKAEIPGGEFAGVWQDALAEWKCVRGRSDVSGGTRDHQLLNSSQVRSPPLPALR